jgi:predicted DNA-binding transcriptional regulator YafY
MLERIRDIHRLIQRHCDHPLNEEQRVTSERLAEAVAVTERQIRRDIKVLREILEKKEESKGIVGRDSALQWSHEERSFTYTRSVDLSHWFGSLDNESLAALSVAQQSLAVFTGNPLASHVKRIFENEAGGMVGNSKLLLTDDITKVISFHPDGAAKIDPAVFATIFRCLLTQNEVRVTYQSKQGATPVARNLRPYHLCCFKQQWRLVAHDDRHNEIRVFVVTPDRMKSAHPRLETFKRPPDVDFRKHVQESPKAPATLLTVRLQISKAGAHHVLEREWTALSSVRKNKDGGVEAVFEVGDLGEFKRFVLSFGSDCEVLAPANFREEIQAEARAVLARLK